MTQAPPASSADTGVEPVGDRQELSRIAYGFMASKALFAALGIDLFSRLADGPRTVGRAVRPPPGSPPTGCAPCCTRSPASGWSCRSGAGIRQRARRGPPPRPRRARRHRRLLPAAGRPADLPALLHLDDGLAGTGAAFDTWAGLLADPAQARTFTDAQHAGSLGAGRSAGRAARPRRCAHPARRRRRQRGVHVRVLRAQPGPARHVLDFPAVVDVAREYLERPGWPTASTLLAGDAAHDPWPADQDVVLMSYLLSALGEAEIDVVLARGAAQPATGRAAGRARLHARRRRARDPALAALWFLQYVASGPMPCLVLRRRARAAAARARVRAGPERQVLIPEITKVLESRKVT